MENYFGTLPKSQIKLQTKSLNCQNLSSLKYYAKLHLVFKKPKK